MLRIREEYNNLNEYKDKKFEEMAWVQYKMSYKCIFWCPLRFGNHPGKSYIYQFELLFNVSAYYITSLIYSNIDNYQLTLLPPEIRKLTNLIHLFVLNSDFLIFFVLLIKSISNTSTISSLESQSPTQVTPRIGS